MSIFNELLSKVIQISDAYTVGFKDDLQTALDSLDKLDEELQTERNSKTREQFQKGKSKTVLQSINEDEDDDPKKTPEDKAKLPNDKPDGGKSNDATRSINSSDSQRARKRSKDDVDGISSPENDKRQKRNASIKAQNIISKQVNVNLTQKMRREEADTTRCKESRNRRGKGNDKENIEPITLVQVKEEKISLPPEPMDMESLPIKIEMNQEQDGIIMPPPPAPVPKPRKAIKDNKSESKSDDEFSGRRRTTRKGKQTDTLPSPVAVPRTRASSRATKLNESETEPTQPIEARPKRTRTTKKVMEDATDNSEKEITQLPQENGFASPLDKPRPKRTRRAKKDAEKDSEKPKTPEEPEIPKTSEEPENPKMPEQSKNPKTVPSNKEIARILQSESTQSPIILVKDKSKNKMDITKSKLDSMEITRNGILEKQYGGSVVNLEETRIISHDATVTLDKTVILPNGVHNYVPVTPKNAPKMNETVVIETNRETIVLEKPKQIMNATIVIHEGLKQNNITADNSLLTDDNSSGHESPPRKEIPTTQPASAVKEKVQQFEELVSRATRTKTRAMIKKEENTEDQTPPDKVSKAVLSTDTLNKMNSMIFNCKQPQISSSATKPRTNTQTKSYLPLSASKLSALSKSREVLEEGRKEERRRKEEETKMEDARKKKEALLEAKKEQQRRKREMKMAAAAAARETAERERLAGLEAALKERMEKQAHADQGKIERMKEAVKKKQDLARKVAETEERRKAEEQARQQRLAEEQKRAEALRKMQQEEAEKMKKEAAIMVKEIEKKQREYLEKQKKQRMEADKMNTPLQTMNSVQYHTEPVYMSDGFQNLHSDEESESAQYVPPPWSRDQARRHQLMVQVHIRCTLIDKLFSVRIHSPDLREIFPNIDRRDLKRTSSAVWRTPPTRLPTLYD